MKDYMKIYQEWLSNPYFDEATKEELRAIEGNENEIKERFYMDLEFGTAGLRGIILSLIHIQMCIRDSSSDDQKVTGKNGGPGVKKDSANTGNSSEITTGQAPG